MHRALGPSNRETKVLGAPVHRVATPDAYSVLNAVERCAQNGPDPAVPLQIVITTIVAAVSTPGTTAVQA